MYLYMFPLWGNGSGAWLRQLASHLVERGHDVAIVAPEKRKLHGVKHYRVRPPQMGVFVGNPELKDIKKYEDMNGVELGNIYTEYVNTTLAAVREFQPEILHVFHTAFLPPVARIAKVLYGIKFIITTHGSDLHYLSRDRRLIGLINDANKVARFITANSTFTRKWYLDMFGHDLSYKTRTIPGGVNLGDFSRVSSYEIEKLNRKYQLNNDRVVLFTGRLTVHKGVEYLIKAAKDIKGTVLILGDGPERPFLEKLINDYKLKNVRLLRYMKPDEELDFHAFYKRADVYVAPSVWKEPLGLVILESMAAACPVIATKTGGIGSIIKDGVNGFLVRPRDSKAIAEKVNMLLADEELRKKMAKKAQESVKDKFTWDKITTRFENMYKKFRYTTREYLREVKGIQKKLSMYK